MIQERKTRNERQNRGVVSSLRETLESASILTLAMLLVAGCARGDQTASTTPATEVGGDEPDQVTVTTTIELEDSPTDQQITAAVLRELREDEAVRASRIEVTTTTNVVTLDGEVDNLLAKQQAVRRAEMVRSVKAIVDLIEVRAPDRPDEALQSDVDDALLYDPATESTAIDVAAADGQVTLSGMVSSWAERQLAERVTAGVRGVHSVENNLTIDPAVEREDIQIRAEIERRLEADRWIDDELVGVEVNDGRVELSGAVASAAARTRAHNDAWVRGVQSVDIEDLEVTPQNERSVRQPDELGELTDEDIETAVSLAFTFDPRVYSFEPNVSVDDGLVTLTGTVDSVAARRAAAQTAMDTVGVWRVRNYLTVEPPEVVLDGELEEHVESALTWNPIVERHEIDVETTGGAVYLYGEVDSEFERSEASRVAGNIAGVIDVENYLRVRGDELEPLPSWAMEQDIETQMFWNPWVNSNRVDVEVDGSTATLTGEISDWRAYSAAIDSAYQSGVDHVISHLDVDDGAPDYLLH